MKYFVSIQYSAIQKTVLRHNRLWSIAGISQGLSRLNEIEFPNITREHGGTVMVAGGGKFTAFYASPDGAEAARETMISRLATSFSMLEFQASPVVAAEQFKTRGESAATSGVVMPSAKEQGIIDNLNNDKQRFRGYGVSFLPHMAVCEECGEYPAEKQYHHRGKAFCRTCEEAWQNTYAARYSTSDRATTLERVYGHYFDRIGGTAKLLDPLYDFTDLFPEDAEMKGKEGGRQRMAVWFSDLNNMNQKVPIWLDQADDQVYSTFNKVKEVNLKVVGEALANTFPSPSGSHLPFRLVVAGGDDLCLVMAEEDILTFATHLDAAVHKQAAQLDTGDDNPLSIRWLKANARPNPKTGKMEEIGPYSFGSSFIIASIHTPFRLIHEQGEKLMKDAKETTDRKGNSINWRIMAESEAVSDSLLEFERPLFISSVDKTAEHVDRLSLEEYLALREEYSTISSSHRFAIISKMIELRVAGREAEFETWLKCFASSERDKSFSNLLTEPRLRKDYDLQAPLLPARLATLFELMSIKGRKTYQKTSQENRR